MTAEDDVDALIERCKLATAEFVRGDPEPYKALFSHRQDVTLANPFFPVVRGWEGSPRPSSVPHRVLGTASSWARRS